MEEWISLNEYMKRYKMGYSAVIKLINDGNVEHLKTEGGHYKIKVGGNSVSKDLYEKEKERRIQAETKLSLLKKLINQEEG